MQSRCIGSFRLATSTPHLHGNFNFTKSVLETAKQSLRLSCTSEFTRQGISLPQDRQSYGRRLLGVIFKAYTLFHFTFQHRAGVRPYTSSYDLAESCVFGKQSPLHIFLQPQYINRYIFRFLLSRSYKIILPSSFNTVLLSALVYSTHPPVSVYSTVLKSS